MEVENKKSCGDYIVMMLFEIFANAILVSAITTVTITGGLPFGIAISLYLGI